jgi:membrane-associated protease RseP (regulator of RpoE activity)
MYLGLIALFAVAVLLTGGSATRADDERRVVIAGAGPGYVVTDASGEAGTAYLGVQLEEETDHPEGGARITRVVDGSPAAEAGLEEGDIIVRFNSDTIRGPVGLTKRLHVLEPGDKASVTVLRDGREQTLDVELGERSGLLVLSGDGPSWVVPRALDPEIELRLEELGGKLGSLLRCDEDEDDCSFSLDLGDLPEVYSFAPGVGCAGGDCGVSWSFPGGRPVLGVQLAETTPELREHLGGTKDAGVLISKIVSGSPAEQAGIRVGDLLLSIDGESVKSARDIRAALHDKRGSTIDVELARDGRVQHIDVSLPAPDDDRPTGPRALHRSHPAAPPRPAAPPAPPSPVFRPLPASMSSV